MISVCMISLGRETIYRTLETVFAQECEVPFEVVIVLQGTLDHDRIAQINPRDIPLHIHTYELGLGFGYYRNQAISHAQGDILAWIDDDEWTADNMWLDQLTAPIRNQTYQVVTAGTTIELGKGYLTDCISYLGYPGGSVIGFDKMWTVYDDGTTKHLCSGNFAFDRSVLEVVGGFEESLKSGAEDVAFGTMLSTKGVQIYREPTATLYHIHRSGVLNFCRWHFLRGKSVHEYMKLGLVTGGQKKDKLRSVKHILFDRVWTRHVFGIWFLFGLQYAWTLIGYVSARFGK